MDKALRILFMEDNIGDIGLLKHELNSANFSFELKQVDTRLDFIKELEDFLPDVILSDYTNPGFSGMEALSLVKELAPTIPFIIVTGTIDEFTAVECMKAGALDYVLKDSLVRIVPAIQKGIEKQRLNAEKKQIENQLKFAVNILENIRDSIIVTDTEGVILFWNKGATIIFGYTTEEMLGKTTKELYPEQNREKFENELKSLIERKEYVGEWKGIKKNGEIIWVYIKSCLLHDNNDKMIGILGVSKDITEMKKNHESLQKSQLKTDLILKAIPDFLIRIDSEFKLLDINIPKDFNLLKKPAEFIGMNLSELAKQYSFLSKEIIYQLSDYVALTIRTGKNQIFYYKIILNNHIFHFEIRLVASGMNEILIMLRDITVKDKFVKGRTFLNGKNTGYTEYNLVYNTEGKIISANVEIANLLGYSSPEELKNAGQIKDIIPEEKIREEIISQLIINEKITKLEVVFKGRRGQLIPLIMNGCINKDKVKNIVCFELFLQENQQTDLDEKQIRKIQELETINTIGSGIAYDFNNIISALSMNIYITEQELPEIHPVRDHLNNLKNILQQASELTGRILNFTSVLK